MDIATVVLEEGVEGVVVSNTTVQRPASLTSSPELCAQTGGLSGQPLFSSSTKVLVSSSSYDLQSQRKQTKKVYPPHLSPVTFFFRVHPQTHPHCRLGFTSSQRERSLSSELGVCPAQSRPMKKSRQGLP